MAARACQALQAQLSSDTLPCNQRLQRAGASLLTFHLEAFGAEEGPETLRGGWCRKPGVVQLAQRIRAAGMAVGVALVPATPAEAVAPYVAAGDVDLVRAPPPYLPSACSASGGGAHNNSQSSLFFLPFLGGGGGITLLVFSVTASGVPCLALDRQEFGIP